MTTTIPHHGKDKPYNGKEDNLQRACVKYLRHHRARPLFFHPANGGSRNVVEAVKFKEMGVKRGVSDLLILEHGTFELGDEFDSVQYSPVLFIELKAKGGKLSKDQTAFLLAAEKRGYAIAVVWNFDAFKALVDEYLK